MRSLSQRDTTLLNSIRMHNNSQENVGIPKRLLQVNFGLWCEVRAHSLRTFFGHFGVLALQTVKYVGGGFRFAAAATLFDFATKTVYYRLTPPLILFQKSQSIADDLASGGVAPAFHLLLNEVLKVVTDCVA
jgi:hypothetical protein